MQGSQTRVPASSVPRLGGESCRGSSRTRAHRVRTTVLPFRDDRCRGKGRRVVISHATGARAALDPSLAALPVAQRLRLLPADVPGAPPPKALLVYFSGTDGTGQAITPQLPGLAAAGFDVRCLYLPVADRSSWQGLTQQATSLLRQLLADSTHQQVTLVGESFGGCLALRVAAEAPEAVGQLVLVNPATCFRQSLSGVSSLVAATNLLSLFPKPLYETAQAVLVPLLVDRERVAPVTTRAVRAMMLMTAPASFSSVLEATRDDATAQQLAAEGTGGPETGVRYMPSATASWRLNLLRSGDVPNSLLATIRAPTLLVASACDRLLPSLSEASRLAAAIPRARRVTLPDSGHTALLEEGVDLPALLGRAGFLPDQRTADQQAAGQQAALSTSDSNVVSMAAHTNRNGPVGLTGSVSHAGSSSVSSSAKDGSLGGSILNGSEIGSTLRGSQNGSLTGSRLKGSLNGAPDGTGSLSGSYTAESSFSATGGVKASVPTVDESATVLASSLTSSLASADKASASAITVVAPPLSAPAATLDAAVSQSDGVEVQGQADVAGDAPSRIRTNGSLGSLNQVSEQAHGQFEAAQVANGASAIAAQAATTLTNSASAAPSVAATFSRGADRGVVADSPARSPALSASYTSGSGSVGTAQQAAGQQARSPTEGSAPIQSTAQAADPLGSSKQRPSRRERNAQKGSKPAWAEPNGNIERAMRQLAGWREVVSPVVLGTENLPDPLTAKARPLLFVGNHTRFGLFDLPLLIIELYSRGITVRGLADPRHWLGPIGAIFESFGAVKAGPLTAARLLREREAVLLFPGGGREVMKRRGEEYQLFWRDDRADFVRLAAKFDALIVPFAAVGADDAYKLFLDTDELLANPVLGPLARGAVAALDGGLDPAETVLPVATIPGLPLPSPFPVPDLRQRLYFRFFEPIDSRDVSPSDASACNALYAQVRATVQGGMASLRQERDQDPGRSLLSRLRSVAARVLPAFDLTSETEARS